MTTLLQKSEILFLYESIFSIPNGDPFTGEQRYDDETKKVLVSDVRIKRFIRDYLDEQGHEIYLIWKNKEKEEDKNNQEKKEKSSGSSLRMKQLKDKYKDKYKDIEEILKQCIDVRLFGGISTEKSYSANITGPVQFAILNPSLNKVNLRMHQNTTVFPSSAEKNQGSIGTTTIVPYSVNQIHGWINPYSAKYSGLTEEDVKIMFKALWDSINNANTRTKSNQNSLLLMNIIYNNPSKKLYGLDNIIKLKSDNKTDEEFRNIKDFEFNFDELFNIISDNDVIVKFYSEIPKIIDKFKTQNKFEAIIL